MEENRIYSKMFNWLFIGLMITFISGYCLSLNENLLISILSVGIIPIIVIELVIAVIMGFRIQKMNPLTAKICYIVYSITTGITFSTIFLAYKMSSIIVVFLITAILFGVLAFIGYTTNKDLTKFSIMLFVALLAAVIISLLNIFVFKSSQLETFLSVLLIFVFLGYVAYDMHNIKYLMNSLDEDKAAVYGAFQLYLDFINLFIRLIELLGKNKD